jgi:putative transposase
MRRYSRWSSAASRKERAVGGQVVAALDRDEVLELLREGLHNLAVELGRVVAVGLLEDEVNRVCGKRYSHDSAGRKATRHGGQRGWVMVDGQKLPLARPRARYTDGRGEVKLERYRELQQPRRLRETVLRRMLHGVSGRNYEEVVGRVRESFGVKRASVSRAFVRATADRVRELRERRWDGVRFAAIVIDGKSFAREMMVAVLGITVDGAKQILGLRQGASENAQVCKDLLELLRERGVATDVPTLFVLDGAKALRAAVIGVWGENALIQRCRVHKKRNIKAYLERQHWPELERRLAEAWGEKDYGRALALLKQTVAWLGRINPDAAGSLQEGLEETLTIVRLGVHRALRKTLASTNVIESAFSVVEQVTGRVKRWRGGDMRWRWCAAGLLHAEQHFRRVDGYRHIGALMAALDRIGRAAAVDGTEKVA